MSYDNLITDSEPDRVITYGDWSEGIIFDVLYGEDADLEADFLAKFDIWPTAYLSDPKEDFYQGATFTRVIQRKADHRLFGYTYWNPIGKHSGDNLVEPNGDEHGLEHEWIDDDHYVPIYVWLPVETFMTMGYRIAAVSPEGTA